MNRTPIVSPLPGTFYRRPSPDGAAFKEDGDAVSAADVIGVVEVMENFQEVTADAAGRAIRFLVDDGESIVAGQALVCCPAKNFHDSLAFFAPGRVAPPCVEPATQCRRAWPATRNPSRLTKPLCGTAH